MPALGKTKVSPSLISTGSLFLGTSSYAVTASYAMNSSGGGGSVQTGSIAKQTVWTNVTSGSTNTITSLNLSSNKWDVSVVEEWDAATLDQYYNSCSLLCHFNGTNGSTTFTDNSKNNLTVTSVNGTAISTAQSKFGGSSVFFDGTNDYLSIPDNSAFDFAASDFTMECWLYPTSHPTTVYLLGQSSNTDYAPVLLYLFNGRPGIAASTNGSTWTINNYIGSALTLNTWSHLALVRYGNKWSIYVNGTENVIAASTSATLYNSTDPFGIGGEAAGSLTFPYAGYIDELRITKGVARYTSNFTPQKYEFPNSRNQVLTRYVGLVGGIDDKYVDYGVEKLSNSSLKLTRLTYPNQPLIGSGSLSGSVSRVYVNVLDYTNVSVTSSYARNSLSASYLIPTSNNTTKAIFGYGYTSAAVSMVNLVSNIGIVANDVTGVGTARSNLAAAGYGNDKAIFGYGLTSVNVSMTNLVSNTGVVATDTTGVGTARYQLTVAGYGGDKAIFGYGFNGSIALSITNLVSNTGVVATDTTGVGTSRRLLAASGYGNDKAIFGYGYTSTQVSMTNLVSNTGVVATDTTGVGTARRALAAAGYGGDKAIFGYGYNGSSNVSMTNLVSSTGVVATDTTGVGTARYYLAAAGYGIDKAIFGYGSTGANVSLTNLVSNTGVVANDTTGVGTARDQLAAAGYSTT